MTADAWVVLAGLGRENLDGARAAVAPVIARLAPGVRARFVLVDNALDGAGAEIELGPDVTWLGGDNRAREFSAWDRGLAWLDAVHAPPDRALLAVGNDTLHRHYGAAWLDGFTHAGLDGAARGLYGWIDAWPREVALGPARFRRWVRTNLFFARAGVLRRLRPLTAPLSDDEIFGDGEKLFREPSPLSENYRAYLRTWLFGEPGDPAFAHVWHSARPASEMAPDFARGKIRSILREHQLSARAQSLGLPLIDARR